MTKIKPRVSVTIPRHATDEQYEQAVNIAIYYAQLFNLPVQVDRPYGITFESRTIELAPTDVSTEGAAWAAEGGRHAD